MKKSATWLDSTILGMGRELVMRLQVSNDGVEWENGDERYDSKAIFLWELRNSQSLEASMAGDIDLLYEVSSRYSVHPKTFKRFL